MHDIVQEKSVSPYWPDDALKSTKCRDLSAAEMVMTLAYTCNAEAIAGYVSDREVENMMTEWHDSIVELDYHFPT